MLTTMTFFFSCLTAISIVDAVKPQPGCLAARFGALAAAVGFLLAAYGCVYMR